MTQHWDVEEREERETFAQALQCVDQQYGDFLRMATNARGFESRWNAVSNDVLRTLSDSGVYPRPKIVRQVKARIRPDFNNTKVRSAKLGSVATDAWSYSPDLRVYATDGDAPFVCTCGKQLNARIGMSVCDCGKTWNSWTVTEAGHSRVLCREVTNDQTTILASRRH